MAISLKSTVIFSATLAALLNAYQYASSYQQREDALAPAILAASHTKTSARTALQTPTKARLVIATRTPVPVPTISPTPTPTPTPSPVPLPNPTVTAIASTLQSNSFSPTFASLYLSVQQQTGTPWELLAAVHKVETGQSGDTDRTSSAGATGPMQFLPATFYSYDAPGAADIDSVSDAMLAAGKYLAANGAASGQYSNALYRYNHSWSYVSEVLGLADSLGL